MSKIRGPRFNIPQIPGLGEALGEIVEWVEQLPKPKKINAGRNILLTEDETSISLEGEAQAIGGSSNPCTFSVSLEKREGTEDSFKVIVSPFTLNGLLPSNYEDVGTVEADETKFLQLTAQANITGIASLRYELVDEATIDPQYQEGKPPEKIKLLAAMIDKGTVKPALCSPVSAIPTVAYVDTSGDAIKSYYYWMFENSAIII